MIGQSDIFRKVLAQAEKAAPLEARVLITGDTGSGKEELARFIHQKSPRAAKPFVAINCAAIPAAMLESELFGHAKGAFTTAHQDHGGLVRAAEGGTLFLDEIADMDLALQAKILRFVDTGMVRKVGVAREEKTNVRIIAATHRNLAAEARAGRFREDLYFRLNVIHLSLPPLRARGEKDIHLLIDYFLQNKNVTIAVAARDLLTRYPWPGNIRELQNVLQKADLLCEDKTITAELIVDILGQEALLFADVFKPASRDAPRPLWQMEQEAIDRAIDYCGGNIPKAARLLEISPSTLYRKKPLVSGSKQDYVFVHPDRIST